MKRILLSPAVQLCANGVDLQQEDDAARKKFTLGMILRADFSTWHRKVWSKKCQKLLALMLELQMEC